jgi:protein transport protein SEC31
MAEFNRRYFVLGMSVYLLQTNLFATGASESDILIWDLNNTDTPMLPGAKSQPADDVLWLSWNRQGV